MSHDKDTKYRPDPHIVRSLDFESAEYGSYKRAKRCRLKYNFVVDEMSSSGQRQAEFEKFTFNSRNHAADACDGHARHSAFV